MKEILLSFIELQESDFQFEIYRKLYDGAPKTDKELKVYKLPEKEGANYQQYYVSLNERQGFNAFQCYASTNRDLTKRLLIEILHKRSTQLELPHTVNLNSFLNTIEISTEAHAKGNRVIVFIPHYLQHRNKFGFLVDIRFRPKDVFEKPDVETLKLSFSLDRSGGMNRNFYADKYNNLVQHLRVLIPNLNALNWGSLELSLKSSFVRMPTTSLLKKQYIFKDGNSESNQYQGIRRHHPYTLIKEDCTYIFIMEDRFRDFANKLFLSLIGKQNPGTFPGMKQVFGIDISKENVQRVRIDNTSQDELAKAVQAVKQIRDKETATKKIAIFIEENSNIDEEGVSDTYYYLKYHLTKLGVPLQVLSHEKINVEKTLKWSTSNIGLALFSKLGGIPWVVKPSTADCLILGIGSAHQSNAQNEIERFFAYSVCVDSSGLYKKLEVLADDQSEVSYLDALKRNLVSLIQAPEFACYTKCALHIPFKIKQKEIKAIQAAIGEIRHIDFKVIKINTKNKYFGYSEHNTRTPYESSLVKLNGSEYLVWFEGLRMGEEILNDRISPPVHIEFLNSEATSKDPVDSYLQDIINLTGTNWRGFNAKVKPISIYYSTIIARYCQAFEIYPDFRKEMLSLDIPWFL
ncbi:Piwi domain-containing protein [Spirosoma linguale]|uniref:Protein argonaute n=1 Tax=Spirosoma linguale (strain ATCC 33905 / DSM 74 / LMG 10896 / Claus 1) TaxID=504472 RepID=D2QGL1_SPILD|nr:stem cell self-renewal protein Piwi domain protein [Spirosoma linguale DSM 74]